MNSGFFYGYCPCCDKVISVPSGTDNTYCCFCGSRFLSAAAFRLYGLKETAVVLSNGKADFRSASASTPDSQKGQPSAFTKPVMMTVRELSRATGVPSRTMGAIRISSYHNRSIENRIKSKTIHSHHAPFIVRKEADRLRDQKMAHLSAKAACTHCRKIVHLEKQTVNKTEQPKAGSLLVYCRKLQDSRSC